MRKLSPFVFVAVFACSGDAVLHERTTTPIGTEGGTARSADGLLSLELAPGTVVSEVEITIETRRDVTNADLLSLVYEIGPDSLTLREPVVMRFEIEGSASSSPTVVRVEGAALLAQVSSFDASTKTVSAEVDHFSMWAVASGASARDGGTPRDGGTAHDGGPRDGGPRDGGELRDGGPRDGGELRDAGPRDGGDLRDTGPRDAGPRDAGPRDGGLANDAGFPDAGFWDAGPRDGGVIDAGPQFPPMITTSTIASVGRCSPYVVPLEGVVWPPASWSLVSGALPAGIELAADGTLHGATSAPPGSYPFTARVTDGAGVTADVTFTLQVRADIEGVRWVAMVGRTGSSTVTHAWVADVCSGAPAPFQVSPAAGYEDMPQPNWPTSGIDLAPHRFAMAPNGHALAYYGNSRTSPPFVEMTVVDLRGAAPGSPIKRLEVLPVDHSVGFTDDGTKLFGIGEFSVHVTDTSDPANPGASMEFASMTGLANTLRGSPDGNYIAHVEGIAPLFVELRDISNVGGGVVGPAMALDPSPNLDSNFRFQWAPTSDAIAWAAVDTNAGISTLFWSKVGGMTPMTTAFSPEARFGGDYSFSTDHDYGFSPDGDWLFYVTAAEALYLVDVGGPTPATPVLATPIGYVAEAIRWSYDGDKLLFTGYAPGSSVRQLFVLDVTGGLPATPVNLSQSLTGVSAETFHGFAWSRDNRRAAYVVPDNVAGDALYIVDAEPPYVRTLMNPPIPGVGVLQFQFAPDGRRIAALTRDFSNVHRLQVASISAATPGNWTLAHPAPTSTANDLFPPYGLTADYDWFWTADGRSLVFMGSFATPDTEEVWITDVSGAPPFTLMRISPMGATPSLDIQRIFAGGNYDRDHYRRR
ncbi:MAG: putative Ig domain-containing protein [Deltaproteobacteria bacterium]